MLPTVGHMCTLRTMHSTLVYSRVRKGYLSSRMKGLAANNLNPWWKHVNVRFWLAHVAVSVRSHGFLSETLVFLKSAVFRVTRGIPCTKAVAAINASLSLLGSGTWS